MKEMYHPLRRVTRTSTKHKNAENTDIYIYTCDEEYEDLQPITT